MFEVDPDARREIRDRVGAGADHIQVDQLPAGVTAEGAEPFIEALWDAWLQVTFTLIAYGFPSRALCDGTATMASFKDEAGTIVRT